MNLQAWMTLAIVTLMFVAMVREWASPALAVWMALITLLLVGVIDTTQALAGLANPAPVTVAALYILAQAVESTGALRPLVRVALGGTQGSRASLLRLLLPSAAASAIFNNTPIVAMLMPQVIGWCKAHGVSPSRLLMPLSFAALLGGLITAIGTSTNLVISGLLQAQGEEPMGMFEITRFGLPVAVIGIVYLVVVSPRLLPDRPAPALASDNNSTSDGPHVGKQFFEAVIGTNSPLIGRNAARAGFRSTYQAAIVSVHRDGAPLKGEFDRIRFSLGDTLLVVAEPDFAERWWGRPDFLIVSPVSGTVGNATPQARLVLAIAAGVVIGAATGLLSILEAALLGVLALITTKAMPLPSLRVAVDVEVIALIAGSFGIGAAIESSGLAGIMADTLVFATGTGHWRWALAGLVFATFALTEFISNNAAAVLLFPVAMSTAAATGADPRTFALAIAVAASCSFLTPIGYQTNTMVFGPGGYRFGDYARLGLPLTVIALLTIVWLA